MLECPIARRPNINDLPLEEIALAWATSVVRGDLTATIRGAEFEPRDLIDHLQSSRQLATDLAGDVDPYIGIDSDKVNQYAAHGADRHLMGQVVDRVRAPIAAATFAAVTYARHNSDALRAATNQEVIDAIPGHLPNATPLLRSIAMRISAARVPEPVRTEPSRHVQSHDATGAEQYRGLVGDPFAAPTRWGRQPGEQLTALERELMEAGVNFTYAGSRKRLAFRNELQPDAWKVNLPDDVSRTERFEEPTIAVDINDPKGQAIIDRYARSNGMVTDAQYRSHLSRYQDPLSMIHSERSFSLWSRDVGFVRIMRVSGQTLEVLRHTSDPSVRSALASYVGKMDSREQDKAQLVPGWTGTYTQQAGGVATISVRYSTDANRALNAFLRRSPEVTKVGDVDADRLYGPDLAAAGEAAARSSIEIEVAGGTRFRVRLCNRKDFSTAKDEFDHHAPPLQEVDDVAVSPLLLPVAESRPNPVLPLEPAAAQSPRDQPATEPAPHPPAAQAQPIAGPTRTEELTHTATAPSTSSAPDARTTDPDAPRTTHPQPAGATARVPRRRSTLRLEINSETPSRSTPEPGAPSLLAGKADGSTHDLTRTPTSDELRQDIGPQVPDTPDVAQASDSGSQWTMDH